MRDEVQAMKCPRCGNDNPVGQRFCGSCGGALPAGPGAEAARLAPPLSQAGTPAAKGRTIEGERKLVTVLFADIVGSTSMAEKLDPEEVTEIMNGAFALLNAAVAKYGGTVARLMGDAVLAIFGAPVTHEDDPERAVRAGLDMLASATGYARSIRQRYDLDFQVRVGINSGLAVIDVVGDQTKAEYTAMGDTTNVAARMQSAAEPGTVLVSADTYRLVKSLFDFQPLGALEVKGKSAPIEVYRTVAPKTTPGKARGLEGLASPLVGRNEEFQTVRDRLKDLRAGRGALVTVIGEAGLGKSRLMAEIRRWAQPESQPQIAWLEGRATSYSQSSSYYPWRQIIRQSIGAQDGDSPGAVRNKLQFTCDCCTLPGGDRPFLEAVLAVESEESLKTIRGYEGSALVQRMTDATRGYICGGAQELPTVLVFDDLHWSDEASLDLLLNVSELTETYPLLIVCLLRPDKDAASWRFVERGRDKFGARYSEIALSPLSAELSRELLGNLLYVEDLPASVRDLILDKSEGNPFFIEEVIRALIDSRHIVRENSHWRATREIVNVTIPNTLAGVLSARIDRLPDDTKRVAQMAAVIGRTFAHRVLDAICAAAPPDERILHLEPHLETLAYQELVRERAREPELEYAFKHALTQEAAYNSLLIKRRKEFHRRVGPALEALYAERLDEFAPTLAHHAWQAEDWAPAAEHSARAGAAAMRVYARREAIGHFERALAAREKVPDSSAATIYDAILDWVEAAFQFIPFAKVLERLARAEKIARELNDSPRLARALHWTATAHLVSGHATRSGPVLTECLSLAEEIGDERLALLPTFWTALALMDADPRGSLGLLDRALELARKHQDPDIEAYALSGKAMALARLGEFAPAQQLMNRAQEAAAQGRIAPMTDSDVDLFAAWAYLDMGDVQRGLEFGQRGLDKAIAADNVDCACMGFACLGFGKLGAQRLPEAAAAFEESIKRTEYSGAMQIQNLGAAGLAMARFLSGSAEATQDMEKALADAKAIGNLRMAAQVSQTLGEIFTRQADYERAESHLGNALEYYRRTGQRPSLALALGSLALLRQKQGRSAEAAQARTEAETLTARSQFPA